MNDQIDQNLLNAVIQQESGGNANAVSPVGAAGIMQIMPDTARDPGFGVRPLQGWDGKDPRTASVEEQIRFGTDYLAAMKTRYNGDQSLTLAAYNAGPGAVDKYGGVPPFEETQDYVKKINANAPPQIQQIPQTQNGSWRERASVIQQPIRPSAVNTPSGDTWRSRASKISEEPGFIDRIKNTVQENTDQMQRAADAYVGGEQSKVETAAQMGLSFASNVPDILGEGISTVTPDFIKDAGAYALKQAGKLPSIDGGTIGEGLPKELDYIAKKYPRFTRNAQAGLDALSLIPTGLAAGAGAKGAVKATENAVNKITSPKVTSKTADDLKVMAQKAYEQADEIGAVFTPSQVSSKFSKSINDLSPKPIAGKVLTSEDKLLAGHLDEYIELGNSPLSISDVQRIDQSLTQKITSNFIDTNTGLPDANGRKLMILQENLRKIVDDVPDNAANDALKNGRSLWKAQTILRDLDAIAERASLAINVGSSLRIGYKGLYNNKKRTRGWPEEAKKLLKKAATPGIADDALQLLSSRLPAIIMGGVGNVAGAATAHTVGAAGRGIKAASAARKGSKVQQSIVDSTLGGLRKVEPKPNVPLMLAAPTANKTKPPLPLTDRQINISRKKMNKGVKNVETDAIIKLDNKKSKKKKKRKTKKKE